MKRNSGFTLIEMVVVLAVVAILAAILTPTITKNIDDSKIARANNEAQVIAAAMGSFYKDLGRWPTMQGTGSTNDYWYLIYSDGNAMNTGGTAQWRSTGGWSARSDTFANHLARNTPGGSAANPYTITGELAWKGPYITAVTADPWGAHYSCNIRSLWQTTGTPAWNTVAVYILSAGKDRIPDTDHQQSITSTTPPIIDGDDVGYRVQ